MGEKGSCKRERDGEERETGNERERKVAARERDGEQAERGRERERKVAVRLFPALLFTRKRRGVMIVG